MFESKPKKKTTIKRTDDQTTYCWSDEEVEGEIASVQNVLPEADETCVQAREEFYISQISEETDEEEVDGEMSEEIFAFKEPILRTVCEIPSDADSETDVEAEMYTTSMEIQEVVELPNLDEDNGDTISKEEKLHTHTAKGQSYILMKSFKPKYA